MYLFRSATRCLPCHIICSIQLIAVSHHIVITLHHPIARKLAVVCVYGSAHILIAKAITISCLPVVVTHFIRVRTHYNLCFKTPWRKPLPLHTHTPHLQFYVLSSLYSLSSVLINRLFHYLQIQYRNCSS